MDTQKSTNQLILELTQAFERLPVLQTQQGYLTNYIQFLAERMSAVAHSPYPKNFTQKPTTIIPELQTLIKKTTDLDNYLTQIHQSTVLALLDVSARNNLKSACEQMIKICKAALITLNPSADYFPKANSGGRPRKDRALQIAVSLAGNYQRLTGKPPMIDIDFTQEGSPAVGEFHRLVDDVFGILGIDANPEGFGKSAIKTLKEKATPKT